MPSSLHIHGSNLQEKKNSRAFFEDLRNIVVFALRAAAKHSQPHGVCRTIFELQFGKDVLVWAGELSVRSESAAQLVVRLGFL